MNKCQPTIWCVATAVCLTIANALLEPSAARAAETGEVGTPSEPYTTSTVVGVSLRNESAEEVPPATTEIPSLSGGGGSKTATPDTVIVFRGTGSLSERWEWSRQAARARGFSRYRVGYSVQPPPLLNGQLYSDRSRDADTGGMSVRGTVRGNLSGFDPGGVDLGRHVDALRPTDVVILVGTDEGGRLLSARSSSATFGVDVEREAILWLGTADARESAGLLVDLYEQADDLWLKADLVTAVGAHGGVDIVAPILRSWLESDEADYVRSQAADWLRFQPDPRSIAALERASESDPSLRVRGDAAEALKALRSRSSRE